MNQRDATRGLGAAALAMALLAGIPASDAAASTGEESPGEREQAARVTQGAAAPGFNLPDEAGRSHSLEEIAGDKSLVLIFFRGVW